MKRPFIRLLLVGVISICFASHPALAQRWEAGAGASAMFLTSGDAVLKGGEFYVRHHLRPRLHLTASLSRLGGSDTSRKSLVEGNSWYDRHRYHVDASFGYAFLRSTNQSLALHIAPSIRYRDDLRSFRRYYPIAFLEDPTQLDQVEAQCAHTKGCVSRRFEVLPSESPYSGTGLVLANHSQHTEVGGMMEIEYGFIYRRLTTRAGAGIRSYTGPESFTWHAGVRLGVAF